MTFDAANHTAEAVDELARRRRDFEIRPGQSQSLKKPPASHPTVSPARRAATLVSARLQNPSKVKTLVEERAVDASARQVCTASPDRCGPSPAPGGRIARDTNSGPSSDRRYRGAPWGGHQATQDVNHVSGSAAARAIDSAVNRSDQRRKAQLSSPSRLRLICLSKIPEVDRVHPLSAELSAGRSERRGPRTCATDSRPKRRLFQSADWNVFIICNRLGKRI